MPRHTSIIPRELAPYLIAPATGNTIAKLACGMADDAVCACAIRLEYTSSVCRKV
ncbi:flavoprotein [Phoenicibacter congonensis]|uniref:flavoprotein n=1 Tax=Phoenicibacter congonensis TaxID=1944646 RepID=UPI0009A7A1B4|nr:flavoprotein [Phoenicibacter congonensis]